MTYLELNDDELMNIFNYLLVERILNKLLIILKLNRAILIRERRLFNWIVASGLLVGKSF